MKNPKSSLLNLCAFSLLLAALYLNFVDLDMPEDARPVEQAANKSNSVVVALAKTKHLQHATH